MPIGIPTHWLFVIVILAIFLFKGFWILKEYERGVILRLGRLRGVKMAGLQWIIPFVDQLIRVDLRVVTMDVPTQDVITRDNVSLKVNAVIYFRVLEPDKAVLQITDYLYATSQLAQTTLRSVCGQHDLDQLLSERDRVNQQLQSILDKQTDAWGIKVSTVEVKHIDLPQEMQRAMARQAEAERERRAKIIHAAGEHEAAERLGEAAAIMAKNPATLQLRYLQTMSEMAAQSGTKMLIPIPIDLLKMAAKMS